MYKKIIIVFLNLFILFLINSNKITISIIGDIMAHDNLQNYAISHPDNYNILFLYTKDIFLSDDLTIANLETPINDNLPISGYPLFNAKSDYLKAIKECGIEVLSLANNHSFDKKEEGIKSTINSVRNFGFYYSGTGLNKKEALTPSIFCIKGYTIGFFSGTSFLNGFIQKEKDNIPYINVFNKKNLKNNLEIIKNTKKIVDIMIVSYHCGTEYSNVPDKNQEDILKKISEAGADIVIGHHPHTLQKIEFYKNVDKRDTIIIYSIGNFISAQARYLIYDLTNDKFIYDKRYVQTAEGIIFQVDIKRWNNKVFFYNSKIIPILNVPSIVELNKKHYTSFDVIPIDRLKNLLINTNFYYRRKELLFEILDERFKYISNLINNIQIKTIF